MRAARLVTLSHDAPSGAGGPDTPAPTNTSPSLAPADPVSVETRGPHRGAVKARPWWLRLLLAQEVGLLVVIGLMCLGLTLASPSIPKQTFDMVKAGTTAEVSPLHIRYQVESGAERVRERTDGWIVAERGVRQRVEQKQIVPLAAADAAVQIEGGWRVSGVIYLAADDWGLESDEVFGPRLQRDPRVNKFFNAQNLVLILTSASFYGIMAVGLTMIIILGGIDLSVGAIYALASVLGAYVLHSMQAGAADAGQTAPLWMALTVGLAVCCGVGGACGFVNGAATVGLRVHPFIITLGGMGVYRGIAFVRTKGLSVSDFPPSYGDTVRTTLDAWHPALPNIEIIPTASMLLVGLIFAFVFSRTVFGRRMFAIGGNEIAAKYAGVPVSRNKITVFTLSGLLAGLAAAIAIGKYGAASSADGTGYELDVIAAAVVGGASLSGGRGSAIGAVLGAIVIGLINNGFESLAIDSNYKQIVIGLAIVIAVVIDQAKHRLGGSRRH